MKKAVIIASVVLFFGSMLTSCTTHHACAGVTTSVKKVQGNTSLRPI